MKKITAVNGHRRDALYKPTDCSVNFIYDELQKTKIIKTSVVKLLETIHGDPCDFL